MAYKIAKQPPKRADELLWEEAGPGLYDDGEVLVQVAGIYAAVSVEHNWLEGKGGNGVAFMGTARWCDAKGETRLTPDGAHVETFFSMSVDAGIVKEHGVDPLKRDVLLVLMGLEPEQMESVPQADGSAIDVPVFKLTPTGKMEASIVHAADTVRKLEKSAPAAALLA